MTTFQSSRLQTSRRDVLKGAGALIVGFSLGIEHSALAQGTASKSVALDEVDGFLSIDAKGAVTVYSGKVDLGTGVRTGITQIVAEELDLPLGRITVIEGDTALTPDQGPSYGSLSIQNGGMQIRQAAATARRALLLQASTRLDVPAGDLSLRDGVFRSISGTNKHVSFAELIGDRTFALKVDKDAPAKAAKDYKIVGKPVARLDIPDKVTGRFAYMHDFRLPDMLHGRVCVRRRSAPPWRASTKARSRTFPGSSRSCVRRIFSAWWRRPSGPPSRHRASCR
jgi:nicotinate dehydrogenase subunit B